MKKLLLLLVPSFVLSACSVVGPLCIEVSNPSDFDRQDEVVEVLWRDVQCCSVLPDNIVVYDDDGQAVPSQLVYDAEGSLYSILFQADVEAGASTRYRVARGQREDYEPKAYGRYVPERMDDYAWENNLTAYRIYGPALKDPQTQGVDVWVKNTSRLIINEWFAKGDYHHNYGEGMDCYKVANTLGGGALAVVNNSQLVLSGNYLKQECKQNGPLRTSADFVYAAVEVGGHNVVMHRTITLDADNRFTRQEYWFEGFEGEIEVVAGIIQHDVKERTDGTNYVALTEAASDSKEPERDGNISLAVVLEGGESTPDIDSHALVKRRVKAGEKIVMLNGAGWSLGGVPTHQEWLEQVERAAEQLAHPLKVEVTR